ncbi:MAG: HAMP domain-containing sensor histidine kinase [Proteocatella sp.]
MKRSKWKIEKIIREVSFKNSIRNRIVISFGAIVALTIVMLEISFVVFISNYYYGGVEQILKDRVIVTSEFINSYAGYSNVQGKARFLFENFLGESDKKFLVQVLDKNGYVIMDSYGFSDIKEIKTPDVESAYNNKFESYIDSDSDTGEKMMSVSRPLMKYSLIDGAVRYTVSLEKIDETIRKYSMASLAVSSVLLLFLTVMAALISKSIVNPIHKLTAVAREMADGDFEIRAEKYYEDEIGELADTLNYMAEEITKTDNVKKDFISSISHELRTPLTSIKGWGETLLLGSVEPDSDAEIGLKIICSEAERLKDIVEELLDFSRLESRTMRVKKQIISPKRLVYSVYRQFLPRTKGIDFTCTLLGMDTMVNGDANRLRQVFINLLTNSLKFIGENAKIALSVEGFEDKVTIIVEDNGIGISEKNLERVKEKFFKENVNSPGSGIGLALVDEILKLHDSTMLIDSKLGVGTKITIIIPATDAEHKHEE